MQKCLFLPPVFCFQAQLSAIKYAIIRKKVSSFSQFVLFSQSNSLSCTPKYSNARTNLFLPALRHIPRNHGGNCFSPVTPLLTPRHPARDYLANLTLKRAHTLPYQLLRIFRKSSLKRRELRSSPVGFAEYFRSVCRNLSGKLPSHPFAALTGLRGCAAGAVG